MEKTANVETKTPQMMVPYSNEETSQFWHNVMSADTAVRIPTGFNQLDKVLGGGLRSGLYVLLAAPGTGKTTLCLQMMDNFARTGTDVILFSGEMSTTEVLAKIYSRYTYTGNALPIMSATDILDLSRDPNSVEIAKVLHEAYLPVAAKTVMVSQDRIISRTTIRDVVEAHIAVTGNRPVVCIDYLQIVAKKLFSEATEKQNVDGLLAQLKEVSNQFDVPILLISSVNRASYNERLTLASAKESGGIEYTADVIIGMDYRDPRNKGHVFYQENPDEPRELELQILKNRMGSWGGIKLRFFAKYSYFEEESMYKRVY